MPTGFTASGSSLHKQHTLTHYVKAFALLPLEHGLEKHKFKSPISVSLLHLSALPARPPWLLAALSTSVTPCRKCRQGECCICGAARERISWGLLKFPRDYPENPEEVAPFGCLAGSAGRLWPERLTQLLLIRKQHSGRHPVQQVEARVLKVFARLVRAPYSTPFIRGLVSCQLGNKWDKGTFFMHILGSIPNSKTQRQFVKYLEKTDRRSRECGLCPAEPYQT